MNPTVAKFRQLRVPFSEHGLKGKGLFETGARTFVRRSTVYCFFLWIGLKPASAAEFDPAKLPPPAAIVVDYDSHIKPIFETSCFRCHGPEKPRSKFRLDDRALAIKGGSHGKDIEEGDSARSPLIYYVARLEKDMEMPPDGKGNPLSKDQIALLRAWIDQGAKWSQTDDAASSKTWFSLSPAIRGFAISGNKARFREHWWMNDSVTGGAKEFSWQEILGDGEKFTAEGRAWFNDENYRLSLNWEKNEFGFVRGGYERYRRYYDDLGGYYAPFNRSPSRLGQDLRLDSGKAWFDLGLTLPNWPKLVLGYEYQFRDGDKSMLNWGLAFDAAGEAKAVYPASKTIDEHVHIVKFDASHEIGGVGLEDNLRAEWFDLRTTRRQVDSFTLGNALPDFLTLYREGYRHFQAANALRAEKQLKEWWLISGGYLFTRTDGNAGFNQTFLAPSDPTQPPFLGDATSLIILDQWSHIFNANSMLGPWEGLSFTTGVQSEWTRQEGLGDAVILGGLPATYGSSFDKAVIEENFGLRYTKIPFTVVYADTRFQQESIGQFEQRLIRSGPGPALDFQRDSDASGDLKQYRAGFSVSPLQRLYFHSTFKHRRKQNDFNHLTDADATADPGNGYPAFITSRDIDTDEIEARLVYHWCSWLKTTFKYQLTATDFITVTAPNLLADVDPATGELVNLNYPGGVIPAGNHDAHTYSLNAVLTPWRRLYLSATFSYSDSRLVTGVNNGAQLAPFAGDLYSVLSSATFAVDRVTDLHANYSFSRADYDQSQLSDGLPLGIVYDRHGLLAGITRRFNKRVTTTLQYGFFRYDEPTSGRAANYTAHGVLATLTVNFP